MTKFNIGRYNVAIMPATKIAFIFATSLTLTGCLVDDNDKDSNDPDPTETETPTVTPDFFDSFENFDKVAGYDDGNLAIDTENSADFSGDEARIKRFANQASSIYYTFDNELDSFIVTSYFDDTSANTDDLVFSVSTAANGSNAEIITPTSTLGEDDADDKSEKVYSWEAADGSAYRYLKIEIPAGTSGPDYLPQIGHLAVDLGEEIPPETLGNLFFTADFSAMPVAGSESVSYIDDWNLSLEGANDGSKFFTDSSVMKRNGADHPSKIAYSFDSTVKTLIVETYDQQSLDNSFDFKAIVKVEGESDTVVDLSVENAEVTKEAKDDSVENSYNKITYTFKFTDEGYTNFDISFPVVTGGEPWHQMIGSVEAYTPEL